MGNSFKLGICQMQVEDNKKSNLKKAREMIAEAAGRGCRLVVLPEMFNCPYRSDTFPDYAEPVPGGETSLMLARSARKEGIYLVGGSIPENDDSGTVYNTCPVFSPAGQLIACHRKLHLFDVDLEAGLSFRESDTLGAGRQVTVFSTSLATVGVAICYDIRFPELARLMALQGAELIVLPGAFNTITGPAHWETLLKARAIDNQVFVVGASPALNPSASYHAWGHSLVVDPWGTVLAAASQDETILYAEIVPARVKQVRRELPLLRHRRTDLYEVREISAT